MAEQNQTNISASSEFDIFQKPTPIISESESIVIPKIEEQKTKEVKQEEDEFNIFQKPTIKVDQQQEDEFSIFQKPGQPIVSTPQKTKEYSAAAKIRYGIDKQNTFFGNVYRVTKAGVQAAFDPEKDFKDYIKYNYEKEQLKLKQKYGELASGAYDDDNLVKAAEIATFMTDPFYILAYMTPWGRAATASFKGLAAVSGTTVGLDVMLDQLATTGTIDAKTVALSAGAASALGPISVKAFNGISKLLPGADKRELAKVIGIVEGKKAKDLGISKVEFHKLQKIAGDKEILSLNKAIKEAEVNFVKPLAEQTKIFNAAEKRISNQIAKLQPSKLKRDIRKIKLLKKKRTKDTEAFNSAQKEFWKTQSKASQKVNELIAKREFTYLKKLKDSQSLTQNVAQAVVSATVRPALGGAIGYGFGRLWGGDDANLNNWMMAGATLGQLQKMIQRSGKVFSNNEKGFLKNIIYNESTRMAFQKARELTATTTSTKLNAFGGATETFGKRLFQELDSPFTKNSSAFIADNLKQTYGSRIFNMLRGTTAEEQQIALSIVRGSKRKATPKVNKLVRDIQSYLKDFRQEATNVNIGLRDKDGKRIDTIKDYFPRVWKWDSIKQNPEKFKKTLADIFKQVGDAGQKKNPKQAAEVFYRSLNTNIGDSFVDRQAMNNIINNLVAGKNVKTSIIKNLPLADALEKPRILKGPYAKVEKILEDNGYLVNDVSYVLNNIVNSSANSIAFAKNFGNRGQFLNDYFKQIVSKYKNNPTTSANAGELATKEIALIKNSIDGFFDRYGTVRKGLVQTGAGTLSTIANLNMLDRVTIASLGDLIQPFTNSNNFTSWIRALKDTSIRLKNQTGAAKDFAIASDKAVQQSLLKTLTPLDDVTNTAKLMGTKGTLRRANEAGFKLMGLQWLTGFARRYAYNTGAIDAFISARKLATYASRNNLTDNKALRLIGDVSKYGLSQNQALRLGKFNNFDEAIKTKFGKDLLNNAGIVASNRDALIPQVSNRLLFTQSRDPLVRLMGQFMSWTLAKSAQTNKLLQRIENGDTRQLVKLLAAIPVYGGIQQLREIAKYGEVQTDIETQTDKWYAEALRLSGISGTLPELFIGRLTGPGSREPWYLFAPAFSILTDVGDITKDAALGDFEKAWKRFSERIAPLPTWRRWISKLWGDDDFVTPIPQSSINKKIGFNTGGEVIVEKNKQEAIAEDFPSYRDEKGNDINISKQEKKMDIKNTAKAAVVAGALATGVNAEVSKAQDNFLLPKAKPKVEVVQKEKPKDYSKLSDLPEDKKKFLLDSASVIYQSNQGKDVPSDILIAIALEETGYGSSRFYKEGNNYFNMVAEKGDERIKAKGDNTQVAKFDSPSESIDKFYTWVETKPHYKNVRETLEKYKQGEATKNDIIDAISDTGWAENPKWSDNVKSILKARVNGKHSEELKSLESSLFKK
jgi:hypothetical protein|tara:strand:+ start:1890 stop:6206 length:4317 start_codon:yes stop_codon:yes gene_type:complete